MIFKWIHVREENGLDDCKLYKQKYFENKILAKSATDLKFGIFFLFIKNLSSRQCSLKAFIN